MACDNKSKVYLKRARDCLEETMKTLTKSSKRFPKQKLNFNKIIAYLSYVY